VEIRIKREPPVFVVQGQAKGVGTAVFPSAKRKGEAPLIFRSGFTNGLPVAVEEGMRRQSTSFRHTTLPAHHILPWKSGVRGGGEWEPAV